MTRNLINPITWHHLVGILRVRARISRNSQASWWIIHSFYDHSCLLMLLDPDPLSPPSGLLNGKSHSGMLNYGRPIVSSIGVSYISPLVHNRGERCSDGGTRASAGGSFLSNKRHVSPSRFDHGTREKLPW